MRRTAGFGVEEFFASGMRWDQLPAATLEALAVSHPIDDEERDGEILVRITPHLRSPSSDLNLCYQGGPWDASCEVPHVHRLNSTYDLLFWTSSSLTIDEVWQFQLCLRGGRITEPVDLMQRGIVVAFHTVKGWQNFGYLLLAPEGSFARFTFAAGDEVTVQFPTQEIPGVSVMR